MNQSEKVHPRGQASAALSLLLFGGPLLYLLAQAWYLRGVSGQLPRVQLAGAGALILGAQSHRWCRRTPPWR
jgi:hypothetical protein